MKDNAPRYRLHDILAALRRGDQRRISVRSRCSESMVSAVLNGKCSQTTPTAQHIIRVAEDFARIDRLYNVRKYR